MVDDENEAERSCALRSVMVTWPGTNIDLLTPYLVISLLDIFLFSFENIDSLLERKSMNITDFTVKKRALLVDIGTFNYYSNFTALGRKEQIC